MWLTAGNVRLATKLRLFSVVDDKNLFALGGEFQALANLDFLFAGVFLEPQNPFLLLLDFAVHPLVGRFVLLYLAALFHEARDPVWPTQFDERVNDPE